jgi:hypothetical protein
MKLFKLRLTTLKSKLYAIVIASFVVRVVVFLSLPNTPSVLGPDEGTYAQVANWTALGKPAEDFPNFGAGLYVSGRSLLLPAALFNLLGLNPLNSVRVTASLYGLFILCLVATFIAKTASNFSKFKDFTDQCPRVFYGLFFIFSFLPSHFLWSNLGLRESVTEFWVITVFVVLFSILHLNNRASILTISVFIISIVMVFSSRPQVGWVLGVSLLIYFCIKFRNRIARILILSTVIAILLGYTATIAVSLKINTSYTAVAEKSTTVKPLEKPTNLVRYVAKTLCESDGQEVEFNGVKYLCTKNTQRETDLKFKNPGLVIIDQADAIPFRHQDNKVGAVSAIQTQKCPNNGQSRFDNYFCIAYRAPFTTFTFLFRPMLGADVTSSSSLFAAAENVFWLGAALFVVVMFIRNRRLAFFGALAPSLLFFSIYSVAAGAYEGNMGTAFRHKSLILWVVLLLLASTIVATQQRKAEREGISG